MHNIITNSDTVYTKEEIKQLLKFIMRKVLFTYTNWCEDEQENLKINIDTNIKDNSQKITGDNHISDDRYFDNLIILEEFIFK